MSTSETEQSDERQLAVLADQLADRAVASIESWVRQAVASRLPSDASSTVLLHAETAGAVAEREVGGRLRQLLTSDIDEQQTNPLAVLRSAVRYPTEVLRAAGVPAPPRDQEAVKLHPDDTYDLTPGAFADFGDDVHEAGILWGAGKAHVHLQRRRSEGVR